VRYSRDTSRDRLCEPEIQAEALGARVRHRVTWRFKVIREMLAVTSAFLVTDPKDGPSFHI
jgi:hypothetical protein